VEAEQRPNKKPKGHVEGIEEMMADKSYHSGAAVLDCHRFAFLPLE
jgi:hypothetical protein